MPTLCITFDYWRSAYADAFPLMGGLPGTYYVAPETIGQAGMPSLAELTALAEQGWEIGGYTNTDMVALRNSDRNAALTKLKTMKDQLWSCGFSMRTIAPDARQWNTRLASLARAAGVDGVRVALDPPMQPLPVPDCCYVNGSYLPSLGTGTSLANAPAYVDKLSGCSVSQGILVLHKVGPVADPYTFAAPDFSVLIACIKDRVAAGTLAVKPYAGAV